MLQVHVTDADTDLHCIAVNGQLVADPSDNIWRPLTEESFALLAIDRVVYGLEVRGRVVGDGGGVDAQQAAGGMVATGQGLLLENHDSAVHVRLTSNHGPPESLASTPEVCGVRENSVTSHSPAELSGQHGRVELSSAIPSSTAQQCFNLLGETAALLPPHATLKVCLHVLKNAPFILRKPVSWEISLPLANPVPASVFLEAYKPGRYVLQVRVSPAGKGMHFVAISGRQMADPVDSTWRQLSEESFTLLSITHVISGLQLVGR